MPLDGFGLLAGPDRSPLQAPAATDPPLDLREANLRDGAFAGADLRDCDARHACLVGADLRGADLRGARLARADLTLARLEGAQLQGADLQGADLQGVDLRDADLRGADLAEVNWAWAWTAGCRGLPSDLPSGAAGNGRLSGPTATGDSQEPSAGLLAYGHGRRAHMRAQLGLAEQYYRLALGWVPLSDAVRYGLAMVALERGDLPCTIGWLRDALEIEPTADRARVDLAMLHLAQGDTEGARTHLLRLAERLPAGQEAAKAAQKQDWQQVRVILTQMTPDSPALRWQPRPALAVPRLVAGEDEAWVSRELSDIQLLLQGNDEGGAVAPEWLWQSVIARALHVGALTQAQRALQRLQTDAPETALWSLQLKQLDMTAEAFAALLPQCPGPWGPIRAVHWRALGVHGPTAKLVCEAGNVYGKRYLGGVRSAASIGFGHRVAAQVAAAGLGAPVALRDRNDRDIIEFAGDFIAFYPDLGERALADADLDEGLAEDIGATIGEIHQALQVYASGPGRPEGGVRAGTRILRHPQPGLALGAAVSVDGTSLAVVRAHPLWSRVVSLTEATSRRLRSVLSDCPLGLTHGDIGPGNIVRQTNGQLGLIDWDLADMDLLVWDLARAVDRMAVHWPSDPAQPVELRASIAKALCRGYQRHRPLHRSEVAALPLLVAASRVDLDASVLPLCAGLEPDAAHPIIVRQFQRLSRAVAGAPEIAALFR